MFQYQYAYHWICLFVSYKLYFKCFLNIETLHALLPHINKIQMLPKKKKSFNLYKQNASWVNSESINTGNDSEHVGHILCK